MVVLVIMSCGGNSVIGNSLGFSCIESLGDRDLDVKATYSGLLSSYII